MAHKKSQKHRRTRRTSSKNIVTKTLGKGVTTVKATSKKYMPKVKSGLENVGSKVITGTKRSVPFLQGVTRKFFSMFGLKTRKNRKQ
jgi:hypothetical protein